MNNIKSLIKTTGPISISSFMKEVMFSPNKGYYKTKKAIGPNQDFITAPQISSIFSRLIANYFFSFISQNPKNQKITFVEMGAGLGTMFFDILQTFLELEKNLNTNILPNVNFAIIETNPVLKKSQEGKLSSLDLEISWFENFEDFLACNQDRKIYFVANELFDCFAIEQFSRNNGKWQEILVGLDQNQNLAPILENFSEAKHRLIKSLVQKNKTPNQENKEKIILEHSFESLNFMNQLSKAIKKTNGMALIIDYGYIDPPFKSTLQAIKNHQKVNIFTTDDPYSCDLTALVDFTALERCAKQNDLQTSLITQGEFLNSLGIQESKNQQENLDLAIERLTSSNQMGELFKCLIVW